MGTSRGNKQLKLEFCPLKKIYTAALPESPTKNDAQKNSLNQPEKVCVDAKHCTGTVQQCQLLVESIHYVMPFHAFLVSLTAEPFLLFSAMVRIT